MVDDADRASVAPTTSTLGLKGNANNLFRHEEYWRDRYTWLQEQGYQLRRRYTEGWIPPHPSVQLEADERVSPKASLVDATRISDGKSVILKRIDREESPHEFKILKYFSQEPLASDPQNHCCPLLDELHDPEDPDHDIAVLPVFRVYDDPDFDTIGEGLDFIHQMVEGFAFLHRHRVVHRDVRTENIMMDPGAMFTEGYFAWLQSEKADSREYVQAEFTRTQKPPRYYIIDFGFSTQYEENELPVLEPPKAATDNTYPEFKKSDVPCDPFLVDVFTVGALIWRDFMKGNELSFLPRGRRGYGFLRPLTKAMTRRDPARRPTMERALAKLEKVMRRTTFIRLRSRSAPRGFENPVTFFQEEYANIKRAYRYAREGLPALPRATEMKRTNTI